MTDIDTRALERELKKGSVEPPTRIGLLGSARFDKVRRGSAVLATLLLLFAQMLSGEPLLNALRSGGYVIVMRHASSPREAPDKTTANADNVKMERQLDEGGRSGATAMGRALRDLRIPIGPVFSSPTYRAMETVRLAGFPNVQAQAELGDGGQSMQGANDTQAAWLKEKITHATAGTNTVLVTHMPNISRAFPEWGTVADGEAVVLKPDGKGGVSVVGRIKIEEWPRLR
jgi:phosphohistidine phosphatase SixA